VDVSFGKYGEADFTPAARVARKLAPDTFVGLDITPTSARSGILPDLPTNSTRCSR